MPMAGLDINGGDQPNVVPSEAAVWYYFRELDYQHIKENYDLGNMMAESAAKMTGTTVDHHLVGSAWPPYYNKVIAEDQQKNIEAVGMPKWTADEQNFAKLVQETQHRKVEPLRDKISPLRPDRDGRPGLAVGASRQQMFGRIERIVYHEGLFLNASLDKASEDNERNALIITTPESTRVAVVQIAGLVARRIVRFVNNGQALIAGQRIGMIRFGSRADVYLPAGTVALVGEGQTAIAGETVLAELSPRPQLYGYQTG